MYYISIELPKKYRLYSLWVSPKLPRMPTTSKSTDGESQTGFKSDLLAYLKSYNLAILKDWIEYVENADFSNVK